MPKTSLADRRTLRTRIFLVEDHAVVRQGMARLLNQEPDFDVCGEASSVDEAVMAIVELRPDVVLADLSLRESNGLDLIREIKRRFPTLPVIVVTMHSESIYAEQAIAAGASGYITKEKAIDTILSGIRRVMGGDTYLSDTTVEKLIRNHVNRGGVQAMDPVSRLSTRERQVLHLIGEWKGTRQIAQELSVGIKTIEYYREQIKAKLGFKTATELVQFATSRNGTKTQ